MMIGEVTALGLILVNQLTTMRVTLLFAFSIMLILQAGAQDKFERASIESIPMFRQFLAIPNDANYLDDIRQNVVWLDEHMQQRQFHTEVWETETRPILFAQAAQEEADKPTVLFYFHADGQSVDPQFWFQDDPYQAVLKKQVEAEGWVDVPWSEIGDRLDPELRVFARSSSDSKNNIILFLKAVDLLQRENKSLPYNLKVIVDFEEEKSSQSLAPTVELKKDVLAADMLVIFDGPRHISGQPTIAFGARGIAGITLTTYGPIFPQHSGHYGNYAPNPALRLAQLLAGMKDDYGRVLIPGYYDGIEFSDDVAAVLDAVPDDLAMINAKLGIARTDSVSTSLQRALQYPSLNIKGISSGWVGSETRTIVPATAIAEIDLRLVKESNPHRLIRLIKEYITSQGYYIVDRKPTARERLEHDRICRMSSRVSYEAFRTDFDSRVGRWLTRALTDAFDATPVRERTMGGSIPISPFVSILDAPAVVVPFANKDNNQHSPNENIRMGNYIDGLKSMYYILSTDVD